MRTMRRFLVNHRWLLAMLLASIAFAAVCAKLNTSGNLVVAGATSHVMIDYPDASIVDRTAVGTAQDDLALLQQHAALDASLMTTPPVLDAIGKRMGVPGGQISGIADITAPAPIQFTMAGSEEHASQLVSLRGAVPARAPALSLRADSHHLRRSAIGRRRAASGHLRHSGPRRLPAIGGPATRLPDIRSFHSSVRWAAREAG